MQIALSNSNINIDISREVCRWLTPTFKAMSATGAATDGHPGNGTGLRDKTDPSVCAKCKSPYWNKPRKNKLDQERWANRLVRQDKGATIPE